MSHDELVEEFVRETKFRGILVVSAIVGILASSILGIAFALGAFEVAHGTRDSSGLGLITMPFATSMLIGGGIYHSVCSYGRRRARTRRRSVRVE